MLGWCIVILAIATLKASVRFPPLRESTKEEALARGATFGIRSRFPAHCSCIMMDKWALSNQRGSLAKVFLVVQGT